MEVNGKSPEPEKEAEGAQKEAGSPRVVDRRRFRAGEDSAPAGPEVEEKEASSRLPTYVEELQRKLAVADEKLREHIDRLNRESAEFRSRQERELERRTAETRKRIVEGFLHLADDLSRALAAADGALRDGPPEKGAVENLIQGIRMIRDQFFQELASHGVKPFSAAGEPFNPLRHEAIRAVPVDDPALDGKVVEEVGHGYLIEDEILRPSRVCVGKFAPPPEGEGSAPQTATDA
ncbi:MAG: nucleotide exchange factor GrpE [bacterium]|nr:nucleotide exchange factor GrpE [bacterium]